MNIFLPVCPRVCVHAWLSVCACLCVCTSVCVCVCVSGCVLVCWLPYICVGVYQAVSGQAVPEGVSCLSAALLLCCPSLNPWSFSMSQT